MTTTPLIAWTTDSGTAELIGVQKPPVPGSPVTPTQPLLLRLLPALIVHLPLRVRARRAIGRVLAAWPQAVIVLGALYLLAQIGRAFGETLHTLSTGGAL